MNFIIGSTWILSAAWIAAVLARGASADLRGRIWRAALAALVLASIPWPAPEAVRISVDAGLGGAASPWTRVPSSPWLVWGLAGAWAAGATLLLARWAAGFTRLAILTRSARSLNYNIRVSDAAATPMTWGVLHPVMVLPTAALDWPEEQRSRALRHERAHIERRDWLWQLFAQLATAVCWFHPLVWLASYELRCESELAADDAVLREDSNAAAYASQLVQAARDLRGDVPLAAVAMVRRSTLEARVAAILSNGRRRDRAGVRARLGVVLATALLLVPVTVLEAAKTYRVGERGLTPPKVASKVNPEYTEEARAAKIQGTTVLTVVVDQKGMAQNIKVTTSLNKGLDAKAVLAVKQWHFEPGTLNGKPVRVLARIEVNFRLL
jgi:TonB family protein